MRLTEAEYEALIARRSAERVPGNGYVATAPRKPLTGRFVLPWPPAELSPNSRPHWAAKSRAAKSYRHACATLARQAGVLSLPDGRLHVTVEFVPPDRRHRDRDNMLASIKSGLDGLADALGVNDSKFDLTIRVADEIGGMVRVTVSHGTAP